MKGFYSRIPYYSTLLVWVLLAVTKSGFADGVISNGTTMKVHSGTYFNESGNRNIQIGAVLDIWGNTTIQGILNNLGDYSGIIIESNINGTGSLIYNSGTPEATIERYLTDNCWHMIGPATDNVLSGQYFFNNSPMVWIKKYVEATDNYEYITGLNIPLQRAKGYAYWIDNSKSDVLTEIQGSLSATTLVLSSSSSPAIEYSNQGFNLIANPYSSAIDWDNPNWEFTNMEESIWVWDPLDNGGNFKSRNSAGLGEMANGIIPSSQGFFVKAISSNPSITIPSAAKTHNDQSFYKSQSSIKDLLSYLVLEVKKGNYWDKVWLGFSEQATEGFDNGLDISKLMGEATAPQLYLVEQDDLVLSINLLPELNNGESRSVAMSFEAKENGMHQFKISYQQNMEGVQVFLEDLKYDVLTELFLDEEISLFASVNDDYNRFILHFNPINTQINISLDESSQIYSNHRAVYISLSEQLTMQSKTIYIYDITGRLIYTENLEAGSFHKIPLQIHHQSVIVKLQFPQKTITKNLIIQ